MSVNPIQEKTPRVMADGRWQFFENELKNTERKFNYIYI